MGLYQSHGKAWQVPSLQPHREHITIRREIPEPCSMAGGWYGKVRAATTLLQHCRQMSRFTLGCLRPGSSTRGRDEQRGTRHDEPGGHD
jgi:hypothetical protein